MASAAIDNRVAQLFGTFGLMLFLRYLAMFICGTDYRIIQKGLLVGKTLSLGPFNLDWTKLSAAALSLLAFFLSITCSIEPNWGRP